MTAVWIGVAFSVLALIAVGVGAWHDYRTNTRTWTGEDERAYRACTAAYAYELRSDREAEDFEQLRDNLWGER